MKKTPYICPIVTLLAFIFCGYAHAGAGLDQRLRAVQEQRRAQQQAIQQRQQSGVMQRQLQQRQAQVMQQQMLQQRQAQATIAQQRVIQEQLQRQAVGQQQLAYQQAQQRQQQVYQQQTQQQQSVSSPSYNSAPSANTNYPMMGMHVEEVVDMKTIWEDFEISSEAWPLIMDRESKEVIVARFMEDFRADGVIFRQSTRHYVELIDSMSFENPSMLKNSFDKVLQMVAIIEYDFDNGISADDLARRVLGEQAYQQNKKRMNR